MITDKQFYLHLLNWPKRVYWHPLNFILTKGARTCEIKLKQYILCRLFYFRRSCIWNCCSVVSVENMRLAQCE